MKRLPVVFSLAILGLAGCDTRESPSLLEPELPEPSMEGVVPAEFSASEDCPNCLVQPTTLVRKRRNPRRAVVKFEGTPGQEAELVVRASNPKRSFILAWFNRKLVVRPFDFRRADSDELRIPIVLKERNLLWVRLIGRKGDQATFWVEGTQEPRGEDPLWTDVGVVPTGSPSVPVVVADNDGLATMLLTDPNSGEPLGAASVLPGLEGMGLVRFGPSGAPAGAFFEGRAAYFRDWRVAGGMASVSVFIPSPGSTEVTPVPVEMPGPFASVITGFLTGSPTASPGGVYGTSSVQGLSSHEALGAQAAWCALQVAGALPSSTGACRTSLIDGVPAFWAQWTETIGYDPFLPTVVGSLNVGGCTGTDCLAQATNLARAAISEFTPGRLIVLAGDAQTGSAETPLQDPLLVLVTNEFDVPLTGILTEFEIRSGGGLLNGAAPTLSTPTDDYGTAVGFWTLGSTLGDQHAWVGTLSFTEVEAEFFATAEEATPSQPFQVTSGVVPVTANKEAVCGSTFGSEYEMADWTRIESAVAAGVEKSAILSDGMAFIKNAGSSTTGGFMSAHYIISASGAVGTVLATLGTDLFWLSSSNSNQRVLCMGPSS